jgi:hypothetical protein
VLRVCLTRLRPTGARWVRRQVHAQRAVRVGHEHSGPAGARSQAAQHSSRAEPQELSTRGVLAAAARTRPPGTFSNMSTLSIAVGDVTNPCHEDIAVIAHVGNDKGGWGRGFSGALSRRWPLVEHYYRDWYRRGINQRRSYRSPPFANAARNPR